MSISKRGKKILVFTALVAAISAGVTISYFRDTEESKDNLFQAGSIDIKLDNTGYYNGAVNELASWQLADLDDGNGSTQGKYVFFNFNDLKPGDWGEDTISLHVTDNPAWVCSDITLTANLENELLRSEMRLQDTDVTGELASELNFVWWADDGDNVLEVGEQVIYQGALGATPVNIPAPFTLADSNKNVWDSEINPLPKNSQKYIATAWCYGELGLAPLQPGVYSPIGRPENGGITCSGASVTDISQSDSAVLDLAFYAVQSRHNTQFVCPSLKYPVNVSLIGTGSGIVNSDILGISCGGDCSEDYYRTQTVTLTTNPDPNSSFTGWSGDCSGSGICVLGIDSVKNVTAEFATIIPPQICGDGIIQGSEGCDDGNVVPGDGCSASCVIETGFDCVDQPSMCWQKMEYCNGSDDDGDGQVDEGWDVGASCVVGQGICAAPGVKVCDPNRPWDATICSGQTGTPQTEVCDKLDNDCDGKTDEGGVCFDWVSPTSTTDTSGNDSWLQEERAYDDNLSDDAGIESYAMCRYQPYYGSSWLPFLELNMEDPLTSGGVRYYLPTGSWLGLSGINIVDVDVFRDGSWVDVYQGSFTVGEWNVGDFTPGVVTKARYRLGGGSIQYYGFLTEFDFRVD